MKEELKPSEQLQNFADALCYDIINTPDEEIMKEPGAEEEAEKMRKIIKRAKDTVGNRRESE